MVHTQQVLTKYFTLTNVLISMVLVKLMLSKTSGWELALCFFMGICNTAYGRYLDAKNDERIRVQNNSFALLVGNVDSKVEKLTSATAKDLETLRDQLGKINLALSIRSRTQKGES